MQKKFFILPALLLSLVVSCVPAKKFTDLEDQYAELENRNSALENRLADCREEKTQAGQNFEDVKLSNENLQQQIKDLKNELGLKTRNLEQLQDSYNALESNSSANLAENSKRNRELLAQLEKKEKALANEQQRLEKLKEDLDARSQRVDELESLIAAKDAKMQALKKSVSNALMNFEGKGLTVEQRNGKVYVSMENKLLFSSGSWAVGSQGKQAVSQLASVLAENKDINVLIEGHTDNVPYGGNEILKDNWDLSTKRATSIVHLLQQNSKINAKRLTAAGRGEFAPIAPNTSASGKAKNRRIEVILTPQYDELSRLLTDE
ncbi:OmpA family protein [Mesonia ostreae]|uniref:OmpA family protein n=1 Tax=Mesonia ostreae TaxID=861110 RepID=A0ABU2KKI1_9FLAO|nr:OmpA family protein [Mesonia ostreae]MDT0295237.1 OmpA family protein [Mesonia ostreae]